MLTDQQLQAWHEDGYICLKSFFPSGKPSRLKTWSDELASLPEKKGKWMFYYERSISDKSRLACRIENFLPYHSGFRELLADSSLLTVLNQLMGEPVYLFKEKINFKLPGANGFTPHQDAPAFAIFNQLFHITVMICIDACTKKNGCLEFAPGRHKEGLFAQEPSGDLEKRVVESMRWQSVYANEGDVIIFGSYIPHRSGPNLTGKPRRALFATYNKTSDQDKRNDYFEAKRKYFPPENERDIDKDYSTGNPFNLGNPIK